MCMCGFQTGGGTCVWVQVVSEARRERHIPWRWSSKLLWTISCWGWNLNSRTLQGQSAQVLNHESYCQQISATFFAICCLYNNCVVCLLILHSSSHISCVYFLFPYNLDSTIYISTPDLIVISTDTTFSVSPFICLWAGLFSKMSSI